MRTPPPPSPERGECLECFYLNEDGTKGDALIHESILDNPEADLLFRMSILRDAIKGGMNRAEAEKLYG
jgi:hypothetical protein